MRGVKDLDMTRKETWKEPIKITDLKKGDIIYIVKTINEYYYTYECKFISFEKGMVTGKILRLDPEWIWIDDDNLIMKARPKCCYLWSGTYCHWCKNGVFE